MGPCNSAIAKWKCGCHRAQSFITTGRGRGFIGATASATTCSFPWKIGSAYRIQKQKTNLKVLPHSSVQAEFLMEYGRAASHAISSARLRPATKYFQTR